MSTRERKQVLADKRRVKEAKQAERTLHAHFAGHRDARRFETFLPCRVSSETGLYLAQVLDISRSGALIRLLDARLPDAEGGVKLMHYAERMTEHFGDGIEIVFRGEPDPVTAELVRVTTRAAESDDPACHLVGVRFSIALSDAQCVALGFKPGRERCEQPA